MKRILFLAYLCLHSLLAFAVAPPSRCPLALPTEHPGFCASFKSVAACHCVEAGLPAGMCQNMDVIYNRMLVMFGSMEKACQYQSDTPLQLCMDGWNCYRLGGRNSQGQLCSATGRAC